MNPVKKGKNYIRLTEERESGKAKHMYIRVHSWTPANKMMVDINLSKYA
jgi:hypothetical protein